MDEPLMKQFLYQVRFRTSLRLSRPAYDYLTARNHSNVRQLASPTVLSSWLCTSDYIKTSPIYLLFLRV